MIFVVTLLVFSLSLLLGLLVSVVASQWLLQSPIRLYSTCILFGLLAVVCTHGLLGLVKASACWPTIFC
jgi:hypothetical protein